jgi:hypothetical protein
VRPSVAASAKLKKKKKKKTWPKLTNVAQSSPIFGAAISSKDVSIADFEILIFFFFLRAKCEPGNRFF